jgi:UDP-N-acetylmuramate dehydrogenase
MNERFGAALSELTTLRVGGRARRLVEAETDAELIDAVGAADAAGEPLLVLAGGSNLVISDDGFDGTVVRVASRGMSVRTEGEHAELDVEAGETWDQVVASCVAEQLAGVECLSGIPGSTGATPIQNVGAYGQEVSQTIASVRTYDRQAGAVVDLAPAECGFAYRASALRHADRHVVLGVRFVLERSADARPVRYAELARALAVAPGDRPPSSAVREAVLALRRAKGMVIDPDDPDSISAGSFFVNPILPAERFGELEQRSSQRLGEGVRPPAWPEGDGQIKTSAAWLIEHAGFHRGYGNGRVGISHKHTLAIVNRGGASANELIALARELRDGVQASFGVTLRPEPTLIGVTL